MTGTTLEQLQVVIEAETRQFRDELARVQAQLNAATAQVEKQTSKIKNAFAGIGRTIAGLGIGYGLYRMGKEALTYASDLTEVQNVVDTAFGDMNYKCEAFAKNSIKQFGMSELSAKRYASNFMAMGKSLGVGLEDGSNMAINLTKRLGDVSSYFNMSQAEIGTKLKGVYTGETEALKDIGVVMTQTNLKQYAMKNGLDSNIESMNQASLTMLRYKFVMEALSDAEGDYSKTFPTWANQIRYLQEQWKQLMGIIGSGLVAVFTPVIQAINAAIGKIIQFAQVVQAVFSSLFGKSNSPSKETKTIASNLGGAEDNVAGLNSGLDKTASKAKKAAGQLASIDEINNMSSSSSGDSGKGASIGGIDGGVDLGFGDEADTSGIDKTVNAIRAKLENLKNMIDQYKVPITAAIAGILAGIGTFAVLKNLDSIGFAIGTMLKPIVNVGSAFSTFFGTLLKGEGILSALSATFGAVNAPLIAISVAVAAVVAALVYLWQTSDTFRKNVTDAINSLFGILKNLYDSIIAPLFGFLADVLATILVPLATFIADVFVTGVEAVSTVVLTLWNNVLAPLANFIVNILGIALKGIIDIWNGWKPVIDLIFAAIMGVWNTVFKPLVDWIVGTFVTTFQNWGDVINNLIPGVQEMFQGLIDFFVGVFSLDIGKCWEGITGIFTGFNDFLTGIFSTDWSENFGFLGSIFNEFFKTIKSIWDLIKGIFDTIINFVSEKFQTDWKESWDNIKKTFSDMWEGLKDTVKNAWDGILGLFANGGKIFSGVVDSISSVFKTIVNCIIGGINTVIAWPFDKINGYLNDIKDFSILGQKPFYGFWGYDPIWVPQIPKLARGAVVTSPTHAIFGEAGAEAVVPLENNTGWMAKIAAGISGFMGFGASEDLNDLIILMQELIDAVRSIDPTVYVGLDADSLADSNQRSAMLKKLRTGRG